MFRAGVSAPQEIVRCGRPCAHCSTAGNARPPYVSLHEGPTYFMGFGENAVALYFFDKGVQNNSATAGTQGGEPCPSYRQKA